jgi:hypothetical protein
MRFHDEEKMPPNQKLRLLHSNQNRRISIFFQILARKQHSSSYGFTSIRGQNFHPESTPKHLRKA